MDVKVDTFWVATEQYKHSSKCYTVRYTSLLQGWNKKQGFVSSDEIQLEGRSNCGVGIAVDETMEKLFLTSINAKKLLVTFTPI